MEQKEIDLSDQIQNWKLDNIIYLDTPKSFIDEADEDFEYLDIDFSSPLVKDLLTLAPFKNSSEQTKQELLFIKNFQNQSYNEVFLSHLKEMDETPAQFIIDYYEEISNKKVSESLKEIIFSRDVERLAMKLKLHFGRARPYQVAEHHGIEISYNKSIQSGTGASPSYPSGHTLIAYFVAQALSYLDPVFETQLLHRARLVALSRIKEGVHFQSDNLFSEYIAEHILMPEFKNTFDPHGHYDSNQKGHSCCPSLQEKFGSSCKH